MKNASTLARRARVAVRAAAVTAALATLGGVGAASASAAAGPSTHTASASASAGAVLVKKITSSDGTLSVYKLSSAPAAPGARLSPNAVIRPDFAYGCSGSNPSVCIDIEGSGLYVETISNSTYFGNAGSTDLQINGPGGVIKNSGWIWETGGWYEIIWAPENYIGAGYYCATTLVNGGHQGACATVHN